jgi:hypothetical protein
MSGEAAPEYIHGTDPEEQARLSMLNDLLNLGSLREHAAATLWYAVSWAEGRRRR